MCGGHGKREFFDVRPSFVNKCAKGGNGIYSTSQRMNMCDTHWKDGRGVPLVCVCSCRYH